MNPLVHPPIDKWSTREKLALASCVLTAGDQNWYSVSRSLKPFGELNRPQDWFAQKNCAIQYGELLENVETPKRKRGEKNEDTAQNLIVRKLTMERIKELKESIEDDDRQLMNLKKNINLLKNDNLSETDQKIIEKQMLDALVQEKKDEEAHLLWLKERDEKYASISRKKSIGQTKTPRKDDSQTAPSTPIKSVLAITAATSTSASPTSQQVSDIDVQIDTNKTVTTIEEQQLIIKQEKLNVQEQANDQQQLVTAISTNKTITREKSKDTDKVQIIVINEDKKQSTDKQTEQTAKDVETIERINKEKMIPVLPKLVPDKIEITVVQPEVKMEVDSVESDTSQKNVVRIVEDDRSGDSESRDDNEPVVSSNKRKRTLTSMSVSTPISQSGLQTGAQQTPASTPTTRRSGRLNPLRSGTNSKTEQLTPVVTAEQSQQQQQQTPIITKKQISTTIDEKLQPLNASQLMFNDESTKDSTTSDLTDTYTSPNSPASSIMNIDPNDPEQVKEQKEFKVWKKSVLLLWREIATHKFSTLFTSPVTDDEAKGYSTVVFRPIDLTTIRKRIENGETRTTVEFHRDILLMFQNAIMYNSVNHEVHKMTLEMQKEVLESIEDFINNQKSTTSLIQSSKDTPSSRRKSRTM